MWVLQFDQRKRGFNYVNQNFKEIHWNVSDKSIWANQCLPWLMLSMDDRIKIVKDSNVFCRICLRLMGMGATTNACGAGKHITSNGKNTSCYLPDCETNVTLCKKHEKINAEKHRLYKAALNGNRESPQGSPMMIRKTIHT